LIDNLKKGNTGHYHYQLNT